MKNRTISRKKTKTGYKYIYSDGRPVTSEEEVKRIKSMRIPPAYTDVTICPASSGKVKAWGYDSKSRKQTIYTKAHVESRRVQKYADLVGFDAVYALIKRDVDSVLRTSASKSSGSIYNTKAFLVRLVVKLCMECHLRIGNEKYVRENGSYGLTTLLGRHVSVSPKHDLIKLDFIGKRGIRNTSMCSVPDVVDAMRYFKKKTSDEDRFFRYLSNDGKLRHLEARDVNEYLKSFDPRITSKDIRTFEANKLFISYFRHLGRDIPVDASMTAVKNVIRDAIKAVAERLHHTPAICKSSYINGEVIDAVLHDIPFREKILKDKH